MEPLYYGMREPASRRALSQTCTRDPYIDDQKQECTYMRFDSARRERCPAAAVLTSGVVTRVQVNQNMSQKEASKRLLFNHESKYTTNTFTIKAVMKRHEKRA